jgi:allantoinase
MLASHGRYAFSALPDRPDWSWPGGKRLAVYVALNVEVFPFGEGLGPEIAPRQPEPDVQNYGWRDYGNRVGIWNVLAALDEHGIPPTALMNAAIYDEAPSIAAALRKRGDEFVGHGRTNAERQAGMDEATERAMIAACRARIAAEEGAPPSGWMGPFVSQTKVTPDLLAEAGYAYLMDWPADDQPHFLATRSGGKILALPYARHVNDLPCMLGAKWPPAVWADAVIDQFEEMRRLSAKAPLVFNLSLHPYLVGVPFRLVHLRRVLAHIARVKDEVWIARAGDLARHAMALPEGTLAR